MCVLVLFICSRAPKTTCFVNIPRVVKTLGVSGFGVGAPLLVALKGKPKGERWGTKQKTHPFGDWKGIF